MDPNYNLAWLFTNEVSQRRFIAVAAEAFEELIANQTEYTSSVIYGPVNLSDREDDGPPQAFDLSGLLNQIEPEKSYISKEHSHRFVSTFFKDISTTAQPEHILTWVVLVIFFVCPRLRKRVAENTEPALLKYFDDFSRRFTLRLCGNLVHKRERKEERSQVKTEALSPFEIVISERILFDFIRSSPPG